MVERIVPSELDSDELHRRTGEYVAAYHYDAAWVRIAELEALLRRIDNVITWETTPLGRQFQEELEAALRR